MYITNSSVYSIHISLYIPTISAGVLGGNNSIGGRMPLCTLLHSTPSLRRSEKGRSPLRVSQASMPNAYLRMYCSVYVRWSVLTGAYIVCMIYISEYGEYVVYKIHILLYMMCLLA